MIDINSPLFSIYMDFVKIGIMAAQTTVKNPQSIEHERAALTSLKIVVDTALANLPPRSELQ